jgi:HemY protein
MFAVLWFLFIAFSITFSFSWLLDHNGDVTVTWLGYQLQSDVLTTIILTSLFSLALFLLSYLIARILAIRFPTLLKFLFRRSYLHHLEKVIKRHHQAFDVMSQALLALEAQDDRAAKKLQKEFFKLTKFAPLNNFFAAKIALDDREFSSAEEIFSKFGENRHAKVLVLQAKFEKALENHEDVKATAYAKQILALQRDNLTVARKLFALYNQAGLKAEADSLIARYGLDELTKNDFKRKARKLNFFKKLFLRS